MPLIVPKKLPAIEVMRKEGIYLLDEVPKESNPLRVILLNLMPVKETTELDFIRVLSHSPLYVQLVLMKISGQTYKNTSEEYMNTFYTDFEELSDEHFDGLIVTGAPVEQIEFEDVRYWKKLGHIFSWARRQVTSTLYVCWGAQAGLYYHYRIPKYSLPSKMFGIFEHEILQPGYSVFRGFDTTFNMPQSSHTEIRVADIERVEDLQLIAKSHISGVGLVMAHGGREFFITGHLEYAPDTLDKEFRRDLAKALPISAPVNYYADDDPDKSPKVTWRSNGHWFYLNWLHSYANDNELNKKYPIVR